MGDRCLATATTAPTKHSSCVLFFLGSERSGTTFVQETFNEFYPVSQANESPWVVRYWKRAHGGQIRDQNRQRALLKRIFADWYFANQANYHQVYFDLEDFVQDGPFRYQVFVEAVFRHIATARGNRWAINKTCSFVEHMEIVDEVFRCPKIVHIVRDGRDVGLSLLEVRAWGPRSIYGAARWWRDRVERVDAYAERHLEGRLMSLRYEDLLESPVECFEKMARFYGIFDAECHAKLSASVRTTRANKEKWRTRMTPADLELFERVAGNALRAHGYPIATDGRRLRPLPVVVETCRRAREAVASRIGFYPLWFRAIRIVNRVIGRFPRWQQKFFRSELFRRRFNWNRLMSERTHRQGRS